mmetsp:Transcript_87383/g.168166  ORF Transcript_87383/g.168166 Transcript_87383/m.168166 type:complete len:85 (-) Transcript_87383:113-367(-)
MPAFNPEYLRDVEVLLSCAYHCALVTCIVPWKVLWAGGRKRPFPKEPRKRARADFGAQLKKLWIQSLKLFVDEKEGVQCQQVEP